MNPFTSQPVASFCLVFLGITFLQSGLDKLLDWKGNFSWLQGHFSKSFLASAVLPMLAVVLLFELLAGVLSFVGLWQIAMSGATQLALCALELCAATLCMLLFGQRVAKDYAGAAVLTGYMLVALLGIFALKGA